MANATRMLLCTCSDIGKAKQLAHSLVKEKLAACVNIVPAIQSVYEWQGHVHEDNEVLLIIKTSKLKVSSLKQAVQKAHSYDSPELISFEIDDGLPEYLNWIEAQTK